MLEIIDLFWGIMLAEHIIDKGVDSICCREDIHDRGPGLMFSRFGIDVRKKGEDGLDTLLQDYFSRSASPETIYTTTPHITP